MDEAVQQVDLKSETKLEEIDPREIVLLEKNAHFMGAETYQRLVNNIRRDGVLTSTPFCDTIEINGEPRRRVLSGNHRVQASIDAGLDCIQVLYVDREIPKDQKIAIQLSHNSIVGEDDNQLLRELYEDISSIDLREYAGLDDKELEILEAPLPLSLNTGSINYKELQILFLPEEKESLEHSLLQIKDEYGDKLEGIACRQKSWDKWLQTISEVHEISGLTNSATAVSVMLEIAMRHLEEIPDILDKMMTEDKLYKPMDKDNL